MIVHVICMACGETGSVLVADEGDVPRCPRCGERFAVESGGGAERPLPDRDIADDVVSWVSQPSESAEPRPGGDVICPACGYAGLMPYDSEHGDAICPACLAAVATKPTRTHRSVNCPGCGRTVEYSDADRGKTIICHACKYFLGCLVPPEKHAYRRAPGGKAPVSP